MFEFARRPVLQDLDKTSHSAPGFTMRELPCMALLRLQALRPRGVTAPAADPALLPVQPNTAIGSDPCVLWKSPDDWLAYSTHLETDELALRFDGLGGGVRLVVTDVSAANTVLELAGAHLLEILARDCTLDLEGDRVPSGACAQTVVAQVPLLLHRPSGRDTWWAFVDRSLAGHLWDWLVDTANLRPAGD
jgi:heterotetrameric sarcosine oxidase gamma subunit